jgi:predicted O-methyltransferase YrrM
LSQYFKFMSKEQLLIQATNISHFFFFIKKNIVAQKASNYKYIRYRVLRPILKSYYKLFNLFYPNRPWTTPASILFFDKVLTKQMIGLEYGSGRSTLYFADKLKKLVSIEHYEGWYDKVANQLEKNRIENVEYHLILKQDTPDKTGDSDTELNKLIGNEPRTEFYNYYTKVNEYNDGFFDFVLIDGRAREKCGLNAIDKLKSGGIFVLDNSERPRYNALHEAVTHWPKVETTTGLTNTTIWIKP